MPGPCEWPCEWEWPLLPDPESPDPDELLLAEELSAEELSEADDELPPSDDPLEFAPLDPLDPLVEEVLVPLLSFL